MISTITPAERLNRLQSLHERKLVTSRTVNGKTVYKYTRRVFWESLWNLDPLLLEARGLVLDAAGNILVRPFTKVFNYMENGTTFPRDEEVIVVEKKNGFLGVVSVYTDATGTIRSLVSTSGSLDSDFVTLATKYLGAEFLDRIATSEYVDTTYMFEICAPEDPHIIQEDYNVYLIGARSVLDETVYTEQELDILCDQWSASSIASFHRPQVRKDLTRFSDVVREAKTVKHEGFMVYNKDYTKGLKIKSPYYLGKKFLSRSKKTEMIWTQPDKAKEMLDEEFYFLIDELPKAISLEDWKEMDDISRLRLVEKALDT